MEGVGWVGTAVRAPAVQRPWFPAASKFSGLLWLQAGWQAKKKKLNRKKAPYRAGCRGARPGGLRTSP